MKVVIDKAYEKYRPTILGIPSEQIKPSHVFCDNRNVVYLIDVEEGEQWVVKKFKRPTLANCVIYTWFRKNKAKRSFEYAYKLLETGIDTPQPIAYIEIPRNGFFHTGYYISKYLPYERMDRVDQKDPILAQSFIKYAEKLYQKGIVNYDFNPNNVLIHPGEDGKLLFSLVDINRIHFKETYWRKHLHAFWRSINFADSWDRKSKMMYQINMTTQYCIDCGFNLYRTALDIHFYSRYKTILNASHRLLKKIIHLVVRKKKNVCC